MSAPRLGAAGCVAVLLVLYLGVGVFDHGVWSPTEPAVAGVVWNMVDSGSLVIPRIDAFEYLEKTPGAYWLSWATCELAGSLDAGWIRLPSALFGLATLWIVAAVARARFGASVALIALLLGGTDLALYATAHRAGADIAVVFFVTAAFGLFARSLGGSAASSPGGGAASSPGGGAASGLASDVCIAAVLALSFYAKNLLPILLAAPPIAVSLLVDRHFARLARIGALSLLCLAVAVAPWAFALFDEGGADALRVVFVDNTLGRFFRLDGFEALSLGPLNDAYTVEKGSPFWYYAPHLFAKILPWPLLFVAALGTLVRRAPADRFVRFLCIALVSIPLVLSVSSSRASNYLDAIATVELWAVAAFVSEWLTDPAAIKPWQRRLAVANAWLVAVALVALPIGLALLGERPGLAAAAPVVALALAAAWRVGVPRVWRVPALLAVSAACLATALAVAMPGMDASRSADRFFAEIAPDLASRRLYTNVIDDRSLPLANHALRRRIETLADRDRALRVLAGAEPAAVLVSPGFYDRRRADFDAIPHRLQVPTSGKPVFVLVTNDPR